MRDLTNINKWWFSIDKTILSILFILIFLSNIFIYISSPVVASKIGIRSNIFIIKNILFSIISSVILVYFSFFSVKKIISTSSIGIVILFLLMVIVLSSPTYKGAKRWFHIFGLSLQPSEIMKPFFIIIISYILLYIKQNNHLNIIISFCLYFIISILLILQPDIGMFLLLSLVYVTELFLININIKFMLIVALICLVLSIIFYFSFSHFQNRINTFVNNILFDKEKSYQVEKSLNAFNRGRLLGKGPLEGSVKNHIPDAHTDFIFSVIGEEFGAIFCIILTSLYFYITIRLMLRALEIENDFKYLTIVALSIMILLQAVINIGSTLNLIPTKGMTLPFISYGGSSSLSSAITFGFLLALSKKDFSESNIDLKLLADKI